MGVVKKYHNSNPYNITLNFDIPLLSTNDSIKLLEILQIIDKKTDYNNEAIGTSIERIRNYIKEKKELMKIKGHSFTFIKENDNSKLVKFGFEI